jgi:glycosyltransferase involved in cell wall biosynthesis
MATARRKRVLVVSNDHVGSSMAGPGIRYVHFARELAGRYDVTLLVPNDTDLELDGVTIGRSSELSLGALTRLAREHDAVVAQDLSPRLMWRLARSTTRVVYDLYDPYPMENLGAFAAAGRQSAHDEREYRMGAVLQAIALATGDAFVCASERQRDLWLGALSALERLDFASYRDDEALRDVVDVVPFGVEADPPRPERHALKGVVNGIGPDDRVLLWGGGVWNWLDPLTPIRAVARLAERRDDVKLYFLGLARPSPETAHTAMARQAVELAEELGVRDRSVFFNFGWVPYAERAAYLCDSDIGISAHLDTVEARFAFRTRVVDYLWAGLPVVATEGDALAELVEARGLGRAVPYGDAGAWADAIEELLDDEAARATAREHLEQVRDELSWTRVVEPLARLLDLPGRTHSASPLAAALVGRRLWLHLRFVQHREGFRGAAFHAAMAALGVRRRVGRQSSARR